MSITISKRQNKRGTVYKAEVRIQHRGKRFYESKTFPKKSWASEWATKREAEIRSPLGLSRIGKNDLTIAEALQRYKEQHNHRDDWGRTKHKTIDFLQRSNLGLIKCRELTKSQVLEHIRIRNQTVKPSTVYNDIQFLKSSLKIADAYYDLQIDFKAISDAEIIAYQQKLLSRSEERKRRTTLDELDKMLSFWEHYKRKGAIPMTECVLFLLFSGRRLAEMCRLRWADLNTEHKTIIVHDMKHPRKKMGNHVPVNLTDEALAIIQRQPKTSDFIFPFDPKSISTRFTRTMKVLGIEDLRLHDLRHEYCSWLGELNHDIPYIANVSGHRDWNMLRRYTHINQYGDKYENWIWRPNYTHFLKQRN